MVQQDENALMSLAREAAHHHAAGRLSEAEKLYRAALQHAPGHPVVFHNLAVVVAAQGRQDEAVALLDQALALDQRYATAHYNKGVALQSLGMADEAIQAFRMTCALEPDHYQSHNALGFLCLAAGERGRSLDHFARTYDLRRGEERTGLAQWSLNHASRDKLTHDAEQFRYLSKHRRDGQRFEMLARAYEEVAKAIPDAASELTAAHFDLLGEDYNTAINVASAPEQKAGTINPNLDAKRIMAAFQADSPAVVWFDDMLSPSALSSLKRYLLESTIWHDFNHIGGFVASYLEDGLACPLILQITDEIRTALPDILGQRPLTQAWAFKGLRPTSAVEAHADDAAVSINFWVTPDVANLNPQSGGLVVCRTPPPATWHMADYDADKAEIAAFLAEHSAESVVVPYRENRAVLFESRLFHSSDAPEFDTGYENHRINITLLFGRHQD